MEVLRFDYQDAKGNFSTRELVNWNDDGWLLKGFCTTDQAPKTFRRDRILKVYEDGGLLLKPIEKPEHVSARRTTVRARRRSTEIEILFTGFPKARRAQLEEAASEAGIAVRKTVTVGLSFVCGGPTAGPTKLRKAQGQGVSVLDEADFLWLLDTGEMPE